MSVTARSVTSAHSQHEQSPTASIQHAIDFHIDRVFWYHCEMIACCNAASAPAVISGFFTQHTAHCVMLGCSSTCLLVVLAIQMEASVTMQRHLRQMLYKSSVTEEKPVAV